MRYRLIIIMMMMMMINNNNHCYSDSRVSIIRISRRGGSIVNHGYKYESSENEFENEGGGRRKKGTSVDVNAYTEETI